MISGTGNVIESIVKNWTSVTSFEAGLSPRLRRSTLGTSRPESQRLINHIYR